MTTIERQSSDPTNSNRSRVSPSMHSNRELGVVVARGVMFSSPACVSTRAEEGDGAEQEQLAIRPLRHKGEVSGSTLLLFWLSPF